jgi:hypothetical protein
MGFLRSFFGTETTAREPKPPTTAPEIAWHLRDKACKQAAEYPRPKKFEDLVVEEYRKRRAASEPMPVALDEVWYSIWKITRGLYSAMPLFYIGQLPDRSGEFYDIKLKNYAIPYY